MRVHSIAWRTDVQLRRLEGARLRERAQQMVVRTPENPTYRWGNFLLLAASGAVDARACAERFAAELPDAEHVAVGVDTRAGERPAIVALEGSGISCEVNTVLTARVLRAPRPRAHGAELRPVSSDEDWRQAIALRLAGGEDGEGCGYREFLERHMAAVRRACERGHGAWLGAFRGGEMLSGLGIFDAGAGEARFQAVDTHPAHRRQGLASSLLTAAGEYARERLGAHTLVIVAEPEHFAIELYRALGFQDHGVQVQLERAAGA